MAILLVFDNDAQGAEHPFLGERNGHRDLAINIQVPHGFPPRLQYDGEGLRGSPFNMCPDQSTLSSRERALPYLARR